MNDSTRTIKTRRQGSVAGFTLVEVMVSASILGFAITGAIVAIQVGFREFELARATAIATQVMQSEAERLRLQNWTTISGLPDEAEVDLSTTISSESLLFGRLQLKRFVDDVTGFANMKEIQLRAEWTSSSGQSHVRTMVLRYSKRGLYDYYYGS